MNWNRNIFPDDDHVAVSLSDGPMSRTSDGVLTQEILIICVSAVCCLCGAFISFFCYREKVRKGYCIKGTGIRKD